MRECVSVRLRVSLCVCVWPLASLRDVNNTAPLACNSLGRFKSNGWPVMVVVVAAVEYRRIYRQAKSTLSGARRVAIIIFGMDRCNMHMMITMVRVV